MTEKGSTLINNGNLTVNREVDDTKGGTLENNGTISGNEIGRASCRERVSSPV